MHDTGWNHPEHVGRLRAVVRAIGRDLELFQHIAHVDARHASADELALCHDRDYVKQVDTLAAQGGGLLDSDTVVSQGSWDAARAATGAVLDAVDMAIDGRSARSFCAVRPPGHHALHARGMGFCLFGSVAIAAHYALARHALERVLIVDWDVHHGNGTQDLVQDEERIRFVSMHQWPWYPGSGAASERGRGNLWNVPMPAGLAPARYVDALLTAVDSATSDFRPQLVLLSSGFDSMQGDPLGGFTLGAADVFELTHEISTRADTWCHGRLVSTMEGGYNTDNLAVAGVAHMRSLAGMAAV